jgi:hypothetical protein
MTHPMAHAALTALLIGSCATVAWAEESQAAALYREGRAEMEAGSYAEACPKIAESQRLEPLLPKLAYLAVCHERQGKTATAYREYLEVAASARAAGLPEREAKARHLAERIAPALLHARFHRAAPRTAGQITCNGSPLPEEAPDGTIALDPGDYECTVAAPGHLSWSTSFTLGEEERSVVVVVPALKPLPIEDPVPATPRPRQAPKRPRRPPATATTTANPVPFYIGAGVAFATGIAGVIVGGVYGARTFDQKDESDALCADGCNQAGVDAMNDARTSSYVSTVGFIVGLAGLGTGAFLTAWGATRPTHDEVALRVAPGSIAIAGAW